MGFYVFDIDGTLAIGEHRLHHLEKHPKDWDAFFDACHEDEPYKPVIHLCKLLIASHTDIVELWTGRPEKVREKTVKWLEDHGIPREGYRLRMRPDGIREHDSILKREWLHEAREEPLRGQPDMIFDDRNSVVRMWRAEGVPCAQVAEGDF